MNKIKTWSLWLFQFILLELYVTLWLLLIISGIGWPVLALRNSKWFMSKVGWSDEDFRKNCMWNGK